MIQPHIFIKILNTSQSICSYLNYKFGEWFSDHSQKLCLLPVSSHMGTSHNSVCHRQQVVCHDLNRKQHYHCQPVEHVMYRGPAEGKFEVPPVASLCGRHQNAGDWGPNVSSHYHRDGHLHGKYCKKKHTCSISNVTAGYLEPLIPRSPGSLFWGHGP